jgi:hypothetical protein
MVLICMWTTPSSDSFFNDHPLAHSMPGAGVVHPIICDGFGTSAHRPLYPSTAVDSVHRGASGFSQVSNLAKAAGACLESRRSRLGIERLHASTHPSKLQQTEQFDSLAASWGRFLKREQIEMSFGRVLVVGVGALLKPRTAAGRSAQRLPAFFFALSIALFVGLTGAWADIYVMESTAPGMRVGVWLTAEETLTIPAGAHVRAVLPSGKTQTIRGPYSAKVSELIKGVESNESLMGQVRKLLETGGSRENIAGGVRSAGPTADSPRGFSLAEIPSWANGKACVLKGANIVLARQSTSGAERAVLVNAKSFERAQVEWEAGSATAAWPANLTLRPDATYQVLVQDREGRDVTVRFMDKAPADDDMLIELHKLGCTHQLETWVRDRMLAVKGKS